MGRQFLRKSRGLFPFGKIEIIPSLWDEESSPFLILQLKDRIMKEPMSFQKN